MAPEPPASSALGTQPGPGAPPGGLRQISADIRSKHDGRGGARPGAGRPKGGVPKNPPPGGGNGVQADSAPGQAVAPPVDRKFIEEAAKTALTAIDGIITRKVYSATCALWPGQPDVQAQAKKFEESIALTAPEIKLFADTMGTIAEKYPKLFGYAPELTLGIFTIGYGARVISIFGEIKKLNVEISQLRAQRTPAPSPAPGGGPHATPPQTN
jgi:hypothetical protein